MTLETDKEEWPGLFPEGFFDVEETDLEATFAEPFDNPERRIELIKRFRELLRLLKSLGISGELWLDGSFVTEKPEPADVDVVLLVEADDLQDLTGDQAEEFGILVAEGEETKQRYLTDFYMCFEHNAAQREYWLKLFGSSRHGVPRGIGRLRI